MCAFASGYIGNLSFLVTPFFLPSFLMVIVEGVLAIMKSYKTQSHWHIGLERGARHRLWEDNLAQVSAPGILADGID